MTEFVVFDVEATSDDPSTAHLLQIAAVRLDAELQEIARFGERLVRSPVPVPPQVTGLTGIRDDDVRDAPLATEVLSEFLAFINGAVLVAHNGTAYDLPLLDRLAAECGLVLQSPLVDSLDAATVLLPDLPSRSLEALRDYFAIAAGPAHRAGADVDALVAVLRALRRRAGDLPPALRALLGWVLGCGSPLRVMLDLPDDAITDPVDTFAMTVPQGKSLVSYGRARRDADKTVSVSTFFAPHGPLARACGEAYEERPGQAQMAGRVWEAFAEDRIALIEAGTGTGKTRAYLLPAIYWATQYGEQVAVSTYTKALQTQLLGELRFLASVEGLAPRPWSAAVLKGRRNYLCLYKLAEAVREITAETAPRRRLALAMLSVWAHDADQGTDDELALGWVARQEKEGEATAAVRGALCDDDCPERRCPLYKPCYFFRAVRHAERADLVVLNHAMALASDKWVKRIDRIVLDEAHDLEEAATEALSLEVEAQELASILGYLNRAEGRGSMGLRARLARAFGLSRREGTLADLAIRVEGTRAALEAGSVAIHRFLDEHDHRRDEEARYGHSFPYAPMVERRPWLRLADTLEQLVDEMRGLAALLDGLAAELAGQPVLDTHYHGPGLVAEIRAVRGRLFELSDLLEGMLRLAERHNRVYLLEAPTLPDRRPDAFEAASRRPDWRFRAPPIEVAEALDERLFGRVRSAVLTSATLTVDHSFAFVRNRLGLERRRNRLVEHQIPSPFDYRKQALLALPGHLPSPRASIIDEYLERLGQELLRFTRAFNGRTLALFTARRHIEVVAEQIEQSLSNAGLALYAQLPGRSIAAILREFRINPHGLLAGTRALWEGVDLRGPDLSQILFHVWIAKLPFPNMGDPLLLARQRRLVERDANANPFQDYLLPLTVLQFKQGFGRLVRTRTDRGTVIVADRRLRGSLYRDMFLNSLPGPSLTESSDLALYREITDFLGLPLDHTLLVDLPLTAVDELIARYRLAPEDDLTTLATKLEGGLALFQLTPPNITSFRLEQLEVMLDALRGDTLVIWPTGAGKSLCFQLPALLRDRVTLVISPLVALMKDQVDKLRRERGLYKARAIDHSVTRAEQIEILEDIATGSCRLLYVAPERLRDQNLVEWLAEVGVAQVVVDEAHCISLWGPTFRPEFLSVRNVVERLGRPPVLALTATATKDVQKDIVRELGLDLGHPPRFHTTSFDRDNLIFGVRQLPSRRAKDHELMRMIGAINEDESAIVYVARKRDAERLAWLIETHCQVGARAYHAGLSASVRASIQEAFTEQAGERLQVIVATKAFGMGIDKPDVRYVIHYDMPDSLEAYYQEAGRAGRDGLRAYCVLLYAPSDRTIQEYFIRQSAPDVDRVRPVYAMITDTAAEERYSAIKRIGSTVYLSPDQVAAETDLDETSVRIILYHLERRGLVARSAFDYGTRARLKLRRPPGDVLACLEKDPSLSVLVKTIARQTIEAGAFLGADEWEFDTLALALKLGITPVELEGALLQLSRPPYHLAIYRSWERGIVVNVAPNAPPPDGFQEDLFAELRQAARQRLSEMRAYISTRMCRREKLLGYLGDDYSQHNCGSCDNCVADLPWPWAGRELPAQLLTSGVDPEWEVLRAVVSDSGRSSRLQLESALRGKDWYGARRAYQINRRLLAADFFGRLQYVPKNRFEAAFARLLRAGLIEEVWRPRPRQADQYKALKATAAGLAAFQAGRLPEDASAAEVMA